MTIPRKILMFHGFAMNASAFYSKTTQLRKLLQAQGFELVYADGPIALRQDEQAQGDGDGEEPLAIQLRAWWITESDGTRKWFDIKPALEQVRRAIREQGPFDGVVGFSQGSALAQAVTNNMESLGNGGPLRFAIFVAGFIIKEQVLVEEGTSGNEAGTASEDAIKSSYILQDKITVPSMLVIGELDTIISNERSLDYVRTYTAAGTNTVLRHAGGHSVPNLRPVARKIADWVARVCDG